MVNFKAGGHQGQRARAQAAQNVESVAVSKNEKRAHSSLTTPRLKTHSCTCAVALRRGASHRVTTVAVFSRIHRCVKPRLLRRNEPVTCSIPSNWPCRQRLGKRDCGHNASTAVAGYHAAVCRSIVVAQHHLGT